MSEFTKESASQVLSQVPGVLRTLLEENTQLTSKLAEFEKRAQAEDIVSEMERRGLSDPEVPHNEKVEAILHSDKDFNVINEAMNLATPNFSFATVSENDTENSDTALESFILGAG